MDFEYIVCDSPAGIESGALLAMHFADEALIVTNPEVSSVRDSDRILGMLVVEDKARDRRQGADQGTPADHALQPEARERRRDAVADRHPGNPAHRTDRRDPRIGSRAACVQPGHAGHAPEGTDVSEAYKDIVVALPRRRKADALHRLSEARLFKRIFGSK